MPLSFCVQDVDPLSPAAGPAADPLAPDEEGTFPRGGGKAEPSGAVAEEEASGSKGKRKGGRRGGKAEARKRKREKKANGDGEQPAEPKVPSAGAVLAIYCVPCGFRHLLINPATTKSPRRRSRK